MNRRGVVKWESDTGEVDVPGTASIPAGHLESYWEYWERRL